MNKGSKKRKRKNKKVVTDGPAKMDLGSFAPLLVPSQTKLLKIIRDYHFEGDKSSQGLGIDLRELNVYSTYIKRSMSTFEAQVLMSLTHIGNGSFSKPRVEALPDKRMLGSLVIVFPTPHEGGVLSLRSRTSGHDERSFDPSPETSDITRKPSIGYVVLLKDVEHEVAPVTSGHRVTLTYDLYAENDDEPVSAKVLQASESVHPLANEHGFRDTFAALLENGEFLADGGTLGFGLSHAYSFGEDFKDVYGALKGSDAAVYLTLRSLGFEPVLRMCYNEWTPDFIGKSLHGHDVVFDEIADFTGWRWPDVEELSIPDFVRNWTDGQLTRSEDLQMEEEHGFEKGAEVVVWATPVTTYNRKESAFACPNERFTESCVAHGDLCLFVCIGKAGERLSYPSPIPRPKSIEAASSEDQHMTFDELIRSRFGGTWHGRLAYALCTR